MASIWRVLLVYVAIRLNNTRARFDLVRLLPRPVDSRAGKSPEG